MPADNLLLLAIFQFQLESRSSGRRKFTSDAMSIHIEPIPSHYTAHYQNGASLANRKFHCWSANKLLLLSLNVQSIYLRCRVWPVVTFKDAVATIVATCIYSEYCERHAECWCDRKCGALACVWCVCHLGDAWPACLCISSDGRQAGR